MAILLTSLGYNFGQEGGGQYRGRRPQDPFDFIPFREKPPAPTGVVVLVTAPGSLLVRWTDYTKGSSNDIGFYWTVRYCPLALAGAGSALPFIPGILDKSSPIGGFVRAEGKGQRLSWTYTDTGLSDGYILVVGMTDRGYLGDPSTPVLMRIAGNTNLTPVVGNVAGQNLLGIFRETEPYDGLRFWFYYKHVPKDDEFAGVHLHVTGYNGVSTLREVGSMEQWDGTTNANISIIRTLPVEIGQGFGTAIFTNGITDVTRVTGTNFSAGWIGRQMVVGLDESETFGIASVTSVNLLDLSVPFTGVSGTYEFVALNTATFYFVPIGKSGARVGDVTTAPSVSI